MVVVIPSLWRISSFLSLSRLVTQSIVLRHLISNTRRLSISFSLVVHASEPYIAIGWIRALYSLVIRFLEIFLEVHIVLLRRPNACDARDIRLFTSDPQSGTKLPRNMNLSTLGTITPSISISASCSGDNIAHLFGVYFQSPFLTRLF